MSKRDPFKYFNSSPAVIRLAVMMYIRYPLSLRNVEDILHERGIDITHETVRYWWHRFGQLFAGKIKKRRIQSGFGSKWRWHLDEVFVKVNGETHYLWRAVDHEGEVLDAIATRTRCRRSALKLLRKLMRRFPKPDVVVTDKLRSYGAAFKELGLFGHENDGRWINNRAENSHQPFRRRERAMMGFRLMSTLQKFTAIHGTIHNHFNLERHLTSRKHFKQRRTAAMDEWRQLLAS